MARNTPLSIAVIAAMTGMSASHALAAEQADGSQGRQQFDEIVVTGTRTLDRTASESLSPIDVLGTTQLERIGSPELNTALSRTLPSFNFPRPSITDGTDHVRPALLRGLAPDQTLVLVNGKRRHRSAIVNVNGSLGRGSSPVDLNSIPISAIKRIEVLRDGAAAQYGSDAIAGVINIVLRDADEGGAVDLRFGEHKEGDGQLFTTSGWLGTSLGDGGFLTVSAEWRDRDPTNRSQPDLIRQQYPLVNGEPDPREAALANSRTFRVGDAATTDAIVFVNGGVPLNQATEFYFSGNYGRREGESAGFFRRPIDPNNVPEIYPDGFLPLIVSKIEDQAAIAGIDGRFGDDWSYDFSVNHGRNQFDFNVHNSINRTLGTASPTRFYAGTLEANQTVVNLDFVRPVEVGLFSPLNVAFGAEYREERFGIRDGQTESWIQGPEPGAPGSQVFPGFRPSDKTSRSRDNTSVYVDLEADLTNQLSTSAALRYEDYSDFGSRTSGKLSGRFEFTDRYAARGTVSTGFRAPALSQQFYSTTATTFIDGVPFEIRTFPVDDPAAIAMGAEPLEAETSVNYSVGLVSRPLDALSVTIDVYRIEIDDRIILSENLTGAAVADFLTAQGFPGVTGGRYFTNAVDTKTEGVDLVALYSLDFARSNLDLTFAYNWNRTEVTKIRPNPPELEAIGLELVRFARVEEGRITDGTPRDKIILGADYTVSDWDVQLTATRFGEWKVLSNNPALDQTFGSEILVDLAVSYTWQDRLRLTVGADNLFDTYPDKSNPSGFFTGNVAPYPAVAPFGYNGRFVYGRIRYSF
jgi:iron complex outermembrane recepter protein